MGLTRRIKKLNTKMVAKIKGRHVLTCKECHEQTVEVSEDIAAVTCADCVQAMILPPVDPTQKKSDKPRGWHFKILYEQDGIVYSRGQVVTDPAQIAELRKQSSNSVQPKKRPSIKKKTRGKKHARTTK